jgi:hypothetical protein
MTKISHPDLHFISSAEGWLILGRPEEALRELELVNKDLWQHPDVLAVRYSIHANQRNWEMALAVAREFRHRSPDRVGAWLDYAYALRRVSGGGLQAAWRALRPALKNFPQEVMVAYNLSCYACQMEQMDEARTLITRALEVGDRQMVKNLALEDDDLRPLWKEISVL